MQKEKKKRNNLDGFKVRFIKIKNLTNLSTFSNYWCSNVPCWKFRNFFCICQIQKGGSVVTMFFFLRNRSNWITPQPLMQISVSCNCNQFRVKWRNVGEFNSIFTIFRLKKRKINTFIFLFWTKGYFNMALII